LVTRKSRLFIFVAVTGAILTVSCGGSSDGAGDPPEASSATDRQRDDVAGAGPATTSAEDSQSISVTGRLIAVRGQVDKKKGNGQYLRVSGEATLDPDDTVRTLPGGFADVLFQIRIPGETGTSNPKCGMSSSSRATVLPDGPQGDVFMNLATGEIVCRGNTKHLNKIVLAGGDTLEFKGTAFKINYQPDRGLLQVDVAEGLVGYTPAVPLFEDGELRETFDIAANGELFVDYDLKIAIREEAAFDDEDLVVFERFEFTPAKPAQEETANPVILFGAGGLLDDPKIQEAIISGIPWAELKETTFAGREIYLSVGERLETDPGSLPHRPELITELLEAGLFEGQQVGIWYPPEDRDLAALARTLGFAIGAAGARVELAEEDTTRIREMILQEIPVIWLKGPP